MHKQKTDEFAQSFLLPVTIQLTWPEDEEGKDATTEAKDEADVEDASSSACGVSSEGSRTKNTCISEFGSRFNTLHVMVEELTFRFFLSTLMAMLLGTILPNEKRELHGLESL